MILMGDRATLWLCPWQLRQAGFVFALLFGEIKSWGHVREGTLSISGALRERGARLHVRRQEMGSPLPKPLWAGCTMQCAAPSLPELLWSPRDQEN